MEETQSAESNVQRSLEGVHHRHSTQSGGERLSAGDYEGSNQRKTGTRGDVATESSARLCRRIILLRLDAAHLASASIGSTMQPAQHAPQNLQ